MKFTLATSLCTALCLAVPAMADDAINYDEETLTGDWGGKRTELSNAGVDIEIAYTADVMGNVSGGIKNGARALDNLDIVFNFDGEKLFGSEGTSASIYLINNNGGHPDADLTGSAQGIDNIEVSDAAGRVYEAWIQQNFFDDALSIRAGLYDLNSEFYVTDSSGLFLHSTYGIGTDFSQSGVNGPSIFPVTSLAARVLVQPSDQFYFQTAVLDAVPGDPNNVHGTHIDLRDNEGALIAAEAGFTPEGGKVAIGGWYYTERAPDLVGAGMHHNQGAYIIGEHVLTHEEGSDDQGLTGFARFGIADDSVNQFDYAWSTGLVYTGLIPGRDEGQLGFGIAGAHNSDDYITSSGPADSNEIALELTYADNITPWLSVQPDVQYIVNPGTDPSLENALAVGARISVNF